MDRLREASLVCALFAFVVGACEPNQPPDLTPQMPYCTPTEQDVEDVDVVTPLGSSARNFLDPYATPIVGQLEWTPSGEGYEILLNTGQEPVDVTVSLSYEGGRIRFLEQELVVPEGQVNDIGVICLDELRIDVALGVSTGDGALAESWNTVLVVGADPESGEPTAPSARMDVELAEIAGTLEIAGIEPTTWSVSDRLRVLIEFHEGGSSGRIQTAVTEPESPSRMVELAAWQVPAS